MILRFISILYEKEAYLSILINASFKGLIHFEAMIMSLVIF
jgi:hypothetical protein